MGAAVLRKDAVVGSFQALDLGHFALQAQPLSNFFLSDQVCAFL
ncbi:hypothetical protein PSEUDO9AZ_10161 [Pseudomonas sp. 9AZ]|nr:hypothetical protein PSEUDO9AZ_10161 [Pseudomonas sp. 9AZ]